MVFLPGCLMFEFRISACLKKVVFLTNSELSDDYRKEFAFG